MFAYTKLMQAMAAAGVVSATDPYFNLTTLLLPGNGTNGAQNNTFIDSSTNNFTITRNGNTTQGTFSPFSQTGWSNYFGATSTYLSFGSNSAFGFSTGAYTVEFWYYPTALSGLRWLCSNDASGGINIYMDGTQLNWGYWGAGGFITVNNAFNLNQWNHIALCRASTSSNQASVFINGIRVANGTDSRDWTVNGPFVIGGTSQSSNSLDGYISNLRVVKGTDVYGVSNTSYTVPTTPLTAITNTSLLTCQSNRFVDNSSNAFAITVNGTPSVQAFSPFAPTAAYSAATNGGSGYFDGSGDYLSVANNTALQMGTGDFQVEAWVYVTNSSAFQAIICIGVSTGGSTAGTFTLRVQSDLKVRWCINDNSTGVTSTNAITANAWVHVCASRVSGTTRIFINGVDNGSLADSNNYNNTSGTMIGAENQSGATNNFYGYISGLRVVKGSGVTSVTVPTSPPTAITNTQLLANYTNAGITDATAKNVLETVGNAQISTTQSKFGGSSMYFPATNGNWCVGPNNPALFFGTGAFTIEFWVYPTAFTNASAGFVGVGVSGSGSTSWNIEVSTAGAVLYRDAGLDRFTSSSNLSLNTWTHIAVVRTSTAVTMYFNGTSVGTYSTINNISYNSTHSLYVGTGIQATGSRQYIGFIDDLRITTGVARYTANFTPPTAAFPVQ